MRYVITAMILLGSGLMVYNIIGFILYARYIQGLSKWGKEKRILYVPIVLLVFFLIGYVVVGIFGNPDLMMAGILLGGSIFVFIIYRLINKITRRIVDTERHEAELMAAEKSDRVKTRFLATMSHEMRTPMNVIIGLDAVALKEPDLPDKTRDHLEKIGLSAKHLLGIINNILNMNRIEAGEFNVKSEKLDLRYDFEQINAIIHTLCEEKGLTYSVVGGEKLGGVFEGDETLIKQTLVSILDNAVKYTDAPGSVEVSVGRRDEDGTAHFSFAVKDTGVGMEKEFAEKLFDGIAQEDTSTTNRFGGVGISLAVTGRIVGFLGGSITAESEKGVGSTFTVNLPLKIVGLEETASEEEFADVSLEGKRILIVEDLPENAEIVADLLELEGAESEHAENGRIGVDMFASSPPDYYDAVLMDLRMPVMDGLAATRAIRSLNRPDAATVPIIALTANAYESDVRQSFDAGMNAHLAKPADSDVLYATLRKYIGRNGGAEK